MLESQIGVDAATTARLIGLAIPLLVAFITKRTASSGLKGALNVVGSAIVGSIVYLVAEDGGYDWTGFVNGTLDTLIPSIASYYALWKPTGVAGSVTNATAGFGLGSPPIVQTDDVGAESAGLSKAPEEPRKASTRRARAKRDDGTANLVTVGLGVLVVGLVLYALTAYASLGWAVGIAGAIIIVVGLVRGSRP